MITYMYVHTGGISSTHDYIYVCTRYFIIERIIKTFSIKMKEDVGMSNPKSTQTRLRS